MTKYQAVETSKKSDKGLESRREGDKEYRDDSATGRFITIPY